MGVKPHSKASGQRVTAPKRAKSPAALSVPRQAATPTAHACNDERSLRSLLANLPGMVYRCKNDRDWTMEYLSEACLDLTGYPHQELMAGKPTYNELILPEDRDRVWADVQDGVHRRATYRLTYRIRTRAGEVRWIWEQGRGVYNENGELLYLEGFITDITDRIEAEEKLSQALAELQQREQQLRTVVNHSPIVLFAMDQEGRFTLSEGQGLAVMGLKPGQVVGQSVFAMYEDAKLTQDLRRALEGETFDVIQPIGDLVFSTHYSAIEGPEGKPAGIIGVATDITSRHRAETELRKAHDELERRVAERTAELQAAYDQLSESESRFRQLAEHITEVFWIALPRSMRLIYVSPAFEEVWGIEAAELYKNPRLWMQSILPEDLPAVQQEFDTVDGSYQGEYRIRRPDGTIRWIHDRGFPVRDSQGQVVRIAGLAEDITQRKQVELQLRTHQADLAHANRLSTMGEMATSISHELNQPLAAVVNYAEGCLRLLSRKAESDVVAQQVNEIIRQTERAATIIKRIRRFTQRRDNRPAVTDLRSVVQHACSLASLDAANHFVKVAIRIQDDLPPILCDPIQIEQVVVNLVRNAIEAMLEKKNGQRLLKVTVRQKREMVEVEVADSGPGVPPESLERIFEAFHSTKPEGVGMGLSISRSIAEAHGGTLTVKSSPRGAAFTLSLPVRTPAESNS